MRMEAGQSVAVVPVPGRAGTVDLVGGALCLDFANTVAPRVEPRPPFRLQEFLTGYPDLVAWGRHAGVLTDAEARRLLAEAAGHPEDTAAIFAEAIALRETVYRIFLAIARGAEPDPADVDTLGAAYAQAMAHARVVRVGSGFDLAWGGNDAALDRPLWPIARSAVELLTGAISARIKDCPTGGEGCGWLFYDTSKNNSRRWCSMRGCGTPAKERRRAERRRR